MSIKIELLSPANEAIAAAGRKTQKHFLIL
jgi:hypothetical protein